MKRYPQQNYEEDEEKKSKYNEAVSQIHRIDNLWQQCHVFRLKGNLFSYNQHLDCIYTELSGDCKLKHKKEFKNFMSLIVKFKNNRIILYQILMKKETFLRKLQDAQGMGKAYKEDDDDFN